MSTAPALSPAEAEIVARFDAAPTPTECDPERVETVARAMWAASHGLPWSYAEFRAEADDYREMAAAAIAAMPPSRAEEAVKRVEALITEAERVREHNARTFGLTPLPARLGTDDLRAALASPAPAPQGEALTDCGCGVRGCVWGHGA